MHGEQEKHIGEQHSNKLKGEGNVCYSDYCEMLGCGALSSLDQERKLASCRALWEKCFPLKAGKISRENQDIFTRKFCQKFMRGGASRKPDLLLEKHDATYDNLVVLKYLGFGFVVVILLVYYLLICLWRSETISTPLMRGRGSLSWSERLLGGRRKEKGY